MAGGWSRDGAVQDQIDASVADAVAQARGNLPAGEGRTHCEECDAEIPAARRKVIAGVKLCVACQSAADDSKSTQGGNRRASKSSQLR